jgi:hypothetical protein
MEGLVTKHSLGIRVGYEVYLTHFGGTAFILEAPRDSLFAQNREGILSLLGTFVRALNTEMREAQ